MLLAADIGGTKTRLAVFSSQNEFRRPLVQKTFVSGDYSGLEVIIAEFVKDLDCKFTVACFGVAGPVADGRAVMTNLAWQIDIRVLQHTFDFEQVFLINDLKAIAGAIPLLATDDMVALNPGRSISHETMALIAPGTGLGEAYLTYGHDGYVAHASEGGHVDFAPTNQLQVELLAYLMDKYDHVSYEKVCSGIGLINLYRFLKDSGRANEPKWLAQTLAGMEDPVPAIVEAVANNDRECDICHQTLDLFVAILGAEAGNFALKSLPWAGVYLGGGIPPRILPFLKKSIFMDAFLNKGRMRSVLEPIPVNVILNPDIALMGAAVYAQITCRESAKTPMPL